MSEDYEKKKAEAVKDKIAEKAAKESDSVDFTIYDVPVELKNQYISMAKLHYDNKVAKVLEDAIESLKDDRASRVDELEERVQKLEEKVALMKSMNASQSVQNDDSEDLAPTFGEPNPEDNTTSANINKLKDLGENT